MQRQEAFPNRPSSWQGEYRSRDRSVHPPAYTPEYKTSVTALARTALISLQQSLSEVTGPVFGPTSSARSTTT